MNTTVSTPAKSKSIANTAKTIGVGAVKVIACPLHMTLQLGSNLLQLGADGVALGEGRVTEFIDGTDREIVANARVEYTQAKFEAAAYKLKSAEDRLRDAINKANGHIDNAVDKVKAAMSSDKQAPIEQAPAPKTDKELVIEQATQADDEQPAKPTVMVAPAPQAKIIQPAGQWQTASKL